MTHNYDLYILPTKKCKKLTKVIKSGKGILAAFTDVGVTLDRFKLVIGPGYRTTALKSGKAKRWVVVNTSTDRLCFHGPFKDKIHVTKNNYLVLETIEIMFNEKDVVYV